MNNQKSPSNQLGKVISLAEYRESKRRAAFLQRSSSDSTPPVRLQPQINQLTKELSGISTATEELFADMQAQIKYLERRQDYLLKLISKLLNKQITPQE